MGFRMGNGAADADEVGVVSTHYGESISGGLGGEIMRKLLRYRYNCRQRRPSRLNFCANSCLNIQQTRKG